ncbi:MAG: hypothetical protein IT159_12125 [Bryobacterales bacterium]|nr:hypothetical protein [Bryobacterales bacterium]
MNETTSDRLNLNDEERSVLAGLLTAERDRLLVEIRHTDHRHYRDQLRRRLDVLEGLIARCGTSA